VPDSVLGAADEVVLIDLTPEALIARLQAGKIYPGENIEAALNNFFKIENLAALRETALRQVAEEVEGKRLVRRGGVGQLGEDALSTVRREEQGLRAAPEAAPQAIAERLLALATLTPESERVVRRAWRSAQRLDAPLDVLLVRPPGRPPSEDDRRRLEELRRTVAMLGASLRVEEGEDVAAVVIRAARALGSTYVLIGTPPRVRPLARFGVGTDLLGRLLKGLPGVDIRVVADPALRLQGALDEELLKGGGLRGPGGEGEGSSA